jgi:hypothetical protein
MKPHIANFLKFLESKDNRKVPLVAKLLYPNKFSPITKEDLFIDGDLDLYKSTIESLPDNITVKGTLDLSGTDIESLPDNLTVQDNLYAVQSKIQRHDIQPIPNNLKVGGSLYLWESPLGNTMTSKQIRQEIEKKGGYVKGNINSL